jgi:glutamate transport system permease protein
MTAPALGEELGPRGRRTVLLVTIAVALLLIAAAVAAVQRFASNGQLEAERWAWLWQNPDAVEFLLGGLGYTLRAAAVSMALALVLGAVLALTRLSLTRFVRWTSGTWTEVFRAVPLLLLIYFTARLLGRYGINVSNFWVLVIGLVLYNGAVLGEIFRAGILSLPRGQTEAAWSVGLTYWQSMRLVILPQALRRMIPALVSQLVTLLKDTSLGFVLPYEELLRRGQIAGEFTGFVLQAYIYVAVAYVVVNFALSRLARALETRQRRRYRAAPVQPTGVEDLAVPVEPVPAHAAPAGAGGAR